MNTLFALAGVVIKEMYRRKDFYVLLVLTAVLTVALGSVRFFNDPNIVRYLKDFCLLLIWISTLVIAITTAARQIPAERENRTIFPLLAKPVTRAQVIVGKFFGCWIATGIALGIFYIFFGVISCSRESDWQLMDYFQAFWLQWMMLGVIIALVLLGSIVFSAPSANVTICFVVVMGIFLLGDFLNHLALRQPEPMRTITYVIYFLIPHLAFFDLRNFIVNNLSPVPWKYCVLATAYAAAYIVAFLFATWLAFRRKALAA